MHAMLESLLAITPLHSNPWHQSLAEPTGILLLVLHGAVMKIQLDQMHALRVHHWMLSSMTATLGCNRCFWSNPCICSTHSQKKMVDTHVVAATYETAFLA